MVRRLFLPALIAGMLIALSAGTALGTIHPLVESADCAEANGLVNRPIGVADVADPPGQTPGATPGNGRNALRALLAVTDGFSDFTSPSLFGHKLDEQCGHAGP